MQIAAITINDGKATPAPHTFTPTKVEGNSATLNERLAAGIAIAWPMASITVKPVDGYEGVNRVVVTLKIPQMEILSGNDAGYTPAPKVAYTDTARLEFLLPGRSTSANRKDLRVMVTNLLANSIVVDAIENIAPPY